MRFIQTHSMGSDCTDPYDIVAKGATERIGCSFCFINNKNYGGRRAVSRHLLIAVSILAHHWRGIIYRGASPLLEHKFNEL